MSHPAPTSRQRLPAAARRDSILRAARETFAERSYRTATTAEIARSAGVSEPMLYRHFESKRSLYLAALADAWAERRLSWDDAIAGEPDPSLWLSAMSTVPDDRGRPQGTTDLWVQALAEAAEDPDLRPALGDFVHEVHDYVAGVVRRAQAQGGVLPQRSADAEAWSFVANGLLANITRRLGAPLDGATRASILAARTGWLTGVETPR